VDVCGKEGDVVRLSAKTREQLRKRAQDDLRWEVVALCRDLDEADAIIAAKDAEIARLRRLVMAVGVSDYDGIICDDVDGVNWFDRRCELAKGEDKP
jgi:hypothetical protein